MTIEQIKDHPMPDPTPAEQLAAIERLMELNRKQTPGPWWFDGAIMFLGNGDSTWGEGHKAIAVGFEPIPGEIEPQDENADFIAAIANACDPSLDVLGLALRGLEAEQKLANIRAKLEDIVCTEGCDAGVVMLSSDGPTHPETHGGRTIQVYDHEYFSPLGDALMEVWKMTHEDAQPQEPGQ